jgi:aryl-alcohol dehydrogenase-like predicted oxidoreductase
VTSPEQFGPDDYRGYGAPRFNGANFAANLALAEQVKAVAAEIGCTPAQAALAWLLAQGEEILPIPGTKRVAYLEENAAAAGIILDEDQVRRLTDAVPVGAVSGSRNSEASLRTVGH